MSWKMFGQIVLLIVIAVMIMCITKCALYKGYKKCGLKSKSSVCEYSKFGSKPAQ